METSKSFNQEYIEKAKKLIHEILEDKKEYDDWTQICFSMQNAFKYQSFDLYNIFNG